MSADRFTRRLLPRVTVCGIFGVAKISRQFHWWTQIDVFVKVEYAFVMFLVTHPVRAGTSLAAQIDYASVLPTSKRQRIAHEHASEVRDF